VTDDSGETTSGLTNDHMSEHFLRFCLFLKSERMDIILSHLLLGYTTYAQSPVSFQKGCPLWPESPKRYTGSWLDWLRGHCSYEEVGHRAAAGEDSPRLLSIETLAIRHFSPEGFLEEGEDITTLR
jgi:hypothetical protein